MSKENISATVDEDVARFLGQDHVNASGLINKLVKEYKDGDDTDGAVLRLREEQLKSELESLNDQRESKRKELERIRQSREEAESGPDISEEADELFDDMETRGVHVWPDAEIVQDLAMEHSMGPDEVMTQLKERAAEQNRDILHTQFQRADMVRGTKGRNIGEVLDDE